MQSRGRQSWGWTDGKQTVKCTGSIMDSWNYTLLGWKECAIHTRQSTVGAVTKENCHPFQIGKILGMHNGMVYNHYELNRKYDRKCSVDSQHIFHHIDEGRDLSEIEAYGAVCFWMDGKIHLGRWNGGELTLARTPFGWAWASTRTALQNALENGGFEEGVTYLRLKEGRCYILDGENVVKSDIKLNFSRGTSSKRWEDFDWRGSSYNTEHGTYYQNGVIWKWDEKERKYAASGTYGPSSGSATSGSGNVSEPKTTTVGDTLKVNDQRRYTEKDLLTAEETGSKQSVEERIGGLLDKTLPASTPNGMSCGGSYQAPAGTVDTPATGAAPASEKDARPKEAKWKCNYCYGILKEGENYYIDIEHEVVCEDCSMRYSENLAYGPFITLPNEIVTVASLFDDGKTKQSDIKFACEVCDEDLFGKDELIETSEHEFVCINCWREVAMDAEIRSTQDRIVEGGCLSANERKAAQAEQERSEQFHSAIAKDLGIDEGSEDEVLAAALDESESAEDNYPIGMDETPVPVTVEKPSNEAAALLTTGEAMPDGGFADFPTSPRHLM